MIPIRLSAGVILLFLATALHAQDGQPKKKIIVHRGTIVAFETVRLQSRVIGFLKTQNVDIGDRVEKGQVLAVIDTPELELDMRRCQAGVEQERARIARAKAALKAAHADVDAAKGVLEQTETDAKGAALSVKFREKQFKRMKDLFNAKAIDEKLVEESQERHEAAIAAEASAKAAMQTAKAKLVASMRRVEQAEAEVVLHEADTEAAQVKLQIARTWLDFSKITAPFAGVITERNFAAGDLIRAEPPGKPLMVLQRVDVMRVVLSVAERDAPLIERGTAATVEVDAFPGKQWAAKVARMAASENVETRMFRVELDVPNAEGRLHHGMTASVSIKLSSK